MITVLSNTGSPAFSNPTAGGGATAPVTEDEETQTGALGFLSSNNLVDLSDVNKSGLNDNDVLVYDALSGNFKPLDITVINDNDGGTWE